MTQEEFNKEILEILFRIKACVEEIQRCHQRFEELREKLHKKE